VVTAVVGRYKRTRLDVAMCVGPHGACCYPLLSHCVFGLKQALGLLVIVVVVLAVASARAHLHGLCSLGISPRSVPTDLFRIAIALCAAGPALYFVLVHSLEGLADAEEQGHEAALGELCVVDEVGVDEVLQVTAAVVGQEDVDGLCRGVGFVRLDRVVDGADDVGVRCKEGVCLDFLERQAHALLPERTADLLQRQQLLVRIVLDEVHV
jgi:hypothetical protein